MVFYRIRKRGTDRFWGRHPNYVTTSDWVGGGMAYEYNHLEIVKTLPQKESCEIVDKNGKVYLVWETETDFQKRVDAAVAKAKAEMHAVPKTTWVGGATPEYYKIEIPVLGVTLLPFDIIEALKLNFNLGCVVKYVLRAGRKGPALDDLKKARNCLDREVSRLEASEKT